MCSSGFKSPVKCSLKSEQLNSGHTCPPGLFCDMSAMLCCPLLLALPPAAIGSSNNVAHKARNLNTRMSSLRHSPNMFGSSKNVMPQISRQMRTMMMSPQQTSNFRGPSNGVAFAPMRGVFGNNGITNFEHGATFFSRRPNNHQNNGGIMNRNFGSSGFSSSNNNNNGGNFGIENMGSAFGNINDYNGYGAALSQLKHKRSLFDNQIKMYLLINITNKTNKTNYN